MLKVLIVEDDPMVREINEKFLKKVEGFTLYKSVNSIEKAKHVLENEKLDLVLLDVFLPQVKGTELLKWIRNEAYKCDVILITADRSTKTIEEAFRYGVVDYLIKPFVFKRFKEALIRYQDRKKAFESEENLEQNIIDRYAFSDKVHDDENVDNFTDLKGFNELTYKKIISGIEDMKDEPFTASQIAELVGVSRITARRYLDYLEKENKLEIGLEYGRVGRPKNMYRVKED